MKREFFIEVDWIRLTFLGLLLSVGHVLGDVANRLGDEARPASAGACLLAHAPLLPDLERAWFEVPASVVEMAVRSQVRDVGPADAYADAPTAAIPGRWLLRLNLNGKRIESRLELSGTVFRATPRRPTYITLFPVNTVFEDLRMNGHPIAPARMRDCWMRAAVTNAGPFRIAVTLAAQPIADGMHRSLRFQPVGFAYASVRFDSVEAWNVRVADGAGRLLGTDASGTHGMLAAPSRSAFSVIWKKPEAERALSGMASVRPSFAWAIGEKTLLANGILDVEILGGAQDRIGLVLPDGADRIQLFGADVRLVERQGARLTVLFRGAVRGRTAMRLSYELPRTRGNLVACPEIEVPGGRLDSGGWLLVANDAEGELLEQQAQGFEPRASMEAPAEVRGLLPGRPVFTYARTGRRGRAVFDAVSTSPFPIVDTIADRADALLSLQDSGEELARMRYSVRNNRKQFLRMILPEGARLLWVSVERKPVSPTQVGREVWIPLLKSVRTLEGLLSFPVEIVYVRSGIPVAGAGQRKIVLPELSEIPTAVIRATLLGPDGLTIVSAHGPLRPVAQFQTGGGFVYGRGIVAASVDSGARKPDENAWVEKLGRNYFESAYDAYRVGRMEDAEDLLVQAGSLGLAGSDTADARNLLSTIRAGRGDLAGAGNREDRARLAKVQKEIGKDASVLESRQDALVQNAALMIESGNEEIGAQLLDEAEVVGKKLVQRGASQREQQGVSGLYRGQLDVMRERKRENDRLNAELATLQAESLRLSSSGKPGSSDAGKAQVFARALSDAAAANSLAPDEAQSVAFSLAAAPVQPKAELDDKVIALQLQDAPGAVASAPAPSATRAGRSLWNENTRLRRQVAALSQAVSKTAQATADPFNVFKQPVVDEAAIREARRLLAKAVADAGAIARQAEAATRTVDAWDDNKLEGRLAPLRRAADAYGNMYGATDATVAGQVNTLRAQIADAEKRIAQAAESRKQSERIVVELGGLVPADSPAEQQALTQFLDGNVLQQRKNSQVQFEIANGVLSIRNEADNAAILGEAVERLQRNRGMAVPVTGVILEEARIGEVPALDRLFTTIPGGRRFAVLDEAQYRTLAEAAQRVRVEERRDVIVGTANRTAGESFRLTHGGRNANDIEFPGVGKWAVTLPQNRYLAIAGKNSVSVLRAGAATPWNRLAERAPVAPSTESAPEMPGIGIPFRFEKTLLAAGESPELEITYQYKPKGERR